MMNMGFLTTADFPAEFEFASNYHFPLKSHFTHPEPQDDGTATNYTKINMVSEYCHQYHQSLWSIDKNGLHNVIPLSRVSSSSELT